MRRKQKPHTFQVHKLLTLREELLPCVKRWAIEEGAYERGVASGRSNCITMPRIQRQATAFHSRRETSGICRVPLTGDKRITDVVRATWNGIEQPSRRRGAQV